VLGSKEGLNGKHGLASNHLVVQFAEWRHTQEGGIAASVLTDIRNRVYNTDHSRVFARQEGGTSFPLFEVQKILGSPVGRIVSSDQINRMIAAIMATRQLHVPSIKLEQLF